ncbi:MAG: HisA/HisF-related TIM barrel protein [Actinomycetota bacterium]
MFDVIPAIDVSNGRLMRLEKGRPVAVEAFGSDPLTAATAFVEAGVRWIHVVDMDLAFTGEAANARVVQQIARLPVKVQASGGISSPDAIDRMLAEGATRVVLSSAALGDRAATESLIESHGDGLVIGLEVDGDRLAPRGKPGAGLDAEFALEWLNAAGPARFLRTSLSRVGELDGPDLEGITSLVERTAIPVVAAGGIATVEQLRAIEAAGAEGAIVGRALHDRLVELTEILRVFDEG